MTPSARQCGPPELLATLPPMVQLCWLLGSGAKCSPRCCTALVRSRLSTPGSTHAEREPASIGQDPVHLRQRDHDRPVERRRAAGQAGAGPASHVGRLVAHARAAPRPAPRRRWSGSTRRRCGRRSSTRRGGTGSARPLSVRTRSGCSDGTQIVDERRHRSRRWLLRLDRRGPFSSGSRSRSRWAVRVVDGRGRRHRSGDRSARRTWRRQRRRR